MAAAVAAMMRLIVPTVRIICLAVPVTMHNHWRGYDDWWSNDDGCWRDHMMAMHHDRCRVHRRWGIKHMRMNRVCHDRSAEMHIYRDARVCSRAGRSSCHK